jgi:adenosine deaminase
MISPLTADERPSQWKTGFSSPSLINKPTPTHATPLFGVRNPSNARVYVDPITGRIDNDIYKLISRIPKTELHVHQGGSTSVEFMIYSYRRAIMDGTILDYLGKDKSLPIYHPDGTVERISLVDKHGKLLPPKELSTIMEKVLTRDNMREYLRIASSSDKQHGLIPNRELAETTADQTKPHKQATSFDEQYIEKIKDVALKEYLSTTGKMNRFNRNPSAAYLLANMYAKEVALERVRYAEYRVSIVGNGLGGNNGVDMEETLSAVSAGFEDAKEYLAQRLLKFDYGLIVLFERQNRNPNDPPEMKVERAKALAREVVRLKKEGKYNIVGVDLAGDEAHNPVTEFEEAFKIIRDYNASAPPNKRLGITIHAGETARSVNPDKNLHLEGWQSIEQALKVGHDQNTPMRIGHGLQLINSSPALKKAFETYLAHPDDWEKRVNIPEVVAKSPVLRYIKENNILLEMCPKSNLQTYGVHPGFANAPDEPGDKYTARSYRRHPAIFLSRLGVKVSLSSDNRTVSNTDAPNEYVKLYKYSGLTYKDLKQMVINGFEAAFIPEPKKSLILEDVRRRFKQLEQEPEMIQGIRKMNNNKITLYQRWLLFRGKLIKMFSNGLDYLRSFLQPSVEKKEAIAR